MAGRVDCMETGSRTAVLTGLEEASQTGAKYFPLCDVFLSICLSVVSVFHSVRDLRFSH